ncbi:hypothetical protein V757_12685 [Pelistega indica]|uniref:Uncharacterized protein n=1 Tax=Pelistega indica TaxID=1414851 RepID=V8FQ38_9BURK|nr:hypothetical protein [Pelistega indica]ETD66419.1 hypothetical protein V757_12685 [Pelistega indica]
MVLARYGLMGCPTGFQTAVRNIGGKIDLELGHLDLPNDLAVALPSPDDSSSHNIPLFCLQRNIVSSLEGVSRTTALSVYFSTKQKESYRSGTFYGAFFEIINQQFNKLAEDNPSSYEMLKDLMQELLSLARLQFNKLIDKNTNTYHSFLDGRSVEMTTSGVFEKIAQESLAPLTVMDFQGRENTKVLVIQCSKSTELIQAVQEVLANKLIVSYQRIFFHCSEEISSKFLIKNKDIRIIHFPTLDNFSTILKDITENSSDTAVSLIQQIKKGKDTLQKIIKDNEHSIMELHQQYNQKIDNLHKQLGEKDRNIIELQKGNSENSDLINFAQAVITQAKEKIQGHTGNYARFISRDDYENIRSIEERGLKVSQNIYSAIGKQEEGLVAVRQTTKTLLMIQSVIWFLSVVALGGVFFFLIDNFGRDQNRKLGELEQSFKDYVSTEIDKVTTGVNNHLTALSRQNQITVDATEKRVNTFSDKEKETKGKK